MRGHWRRFRATAAAGEQDGYAAVDEEEPEPHLVRWIVRLDEAACQLPVGTNATWMVFLVPIRKRTRLLHTPARRVTPPPWW